MNMLEHIVFAERAAASQLYEVPRMTQQTSGRAPEYKVYLAWDVPMRWLHWINALAVLGLIASGLVILNDDTLGVSSAGKILLKRAPRKIGASLHRASLAWDSLASSI